MADDHSAPLADADDEPLPDLTPEEIAELDAEAAEAEADYEAGRWVSHEAVLRWVKSWGTDNPLPRPKWGE